MPVTLICCEMRNIPERAWILLAEDQEDFILLITKAFKDAGIRNPIYAVRDGEEVISYLNGDGKYCNRAEYPLPDLLLLDIKMPGKDGFEVLEWVRAQPGLKDLRIVVLTSSEQIREINRAYALGANSFLVKPLDFNDLIYLSKTVRDFWLGLSKAPEATRPSPYPEKGKSGGTNAGH